MSENTYEVWVTLQVVMNTSFPVTVTAQQEEDAREKVEGWDNFPLPTYLKELNENHNYDVVQQNVVEISNAEQVED